MYVCVCVYTPLFIYSSIGGHLDCCHVSAIVNDAAINIGMHISPWKPLYIYFGYIPRSITPGLYKSILFSIVVGPTYIHQQCIRVPFSPHPHQQGGKQFEDIRITQFQIEGIIKYNVPILLLNLCFKLGISLWVIIPWQITTLLKPGI